MAKKKDRGVGNAPTKKDSTKVKDRGVDSTAVAADQSEKDEVCLKTFLNNGNEVTLTTGRTVKVRDLPFEAWLEGMSAILPVLAGLADSGMDERQLLIVLAKDKSIREQVFEMMHCGTFDEQLSVEDIRELGAKDTMRLLIGFKEVVDFDGVGELFTQLVSPR